MKLLLDQGTPRSAAALLTRAGFESVHVADIGLSKADDHILLQHARVEGQVVVALDADFHAMLALSGATSPSVIRVRIEGLKGDELADLIIHVIQRCKEDLEHGALVTVTEKRIRVRRLPIVR